MAESMAAGPRKGVRAKWLVTWVVIALAVTVGAFIAGQFVRSPWDAAIENSHAEPEVLVSIEQREFAAAVVEAEGTVALGAVMQIEPDAEEGKSVVTNVFKGVGDRVDSGQQLMEISGRPIIVLQLPFPLYRDILPGDSGPDVRVVQERLKALGHYRGRADGIYLAGTATAVRALYAAAGAVRPEPTAENVAALNEACSAYAAAEAEGGDTKAIEAQLAQAQLAAETPLRAAEIVSMTADHSDLVSILPVGAQLGAETKSVAALRSGAPGARVRVSVGDAESFPVGQSIEISAVANSANVVLGAVSAVGPFVMADPETGVDLPGYDVDLTFDSLEGLPFGDGVKVLARTRGSSEIKTGLAVPLIGLRSDSAGPYLFIKTKSEPRRANVTVVMESDGYALIESPDIAAGDEAIVTDGS